MASWSSKWVRVVVICSTVARRAAARAYEIAGDGPGDGQRLVADGVTSLGGRLPVNPSGGLVARGHPIGATGLGQIHEASQQLRGRCGTRQVEGARLALTQNAGGWLEADNAAISVHVLRRPG